MNTDEARLISTGNQKLSRSEISYKKWKMKFTKLPSSLKAIQLKPYSEKLKIEVDFK
jgi:hypothetical protein